MSEYAINGVVQNRGALDKALTAHFGAAIFGVSHDVSVGVRVNFAGEPQAQQITDVGAIINGHGALVLSVDKVQINADGLDAAVVSWSGVGGVDAFDYTIRLNGNGEVFASGTDNAAPFGITFKTPTAGVYQFTVKKQGTFETGFVTVEAN